jgi:hypothetical protein
MKYMYSVPLGSHRARKLSRAGANGQRRKPFGRTGQACRSAVAPIYGLGMSLMSRRDIDFIAFHRAAERHLGLALDDAVSQLLVRQKSLLANRASESIPQGDNGGNKRPTGKRFSHGEREIARQPALDDIALGPDRHSSAHVIRVVVYAQKYDLCPGAHGFQPPCRLDAVQYGHRNVEHQKVRLLPGGFVEQRLTIADRPDHLELRLEQAYRDSQELNVVIGQQHT